MSTTVLKSSAETGSKITDSRETGQNAMIETTPIGRRGLLLSLVTLTGLLIAGNGRSLQAASLDDLRKQGTVGERFDGYAVARDNNAQGFVKDVNAKRSKIYEREAKKTGANVTAVGKIFAKQIMEKAPSGTWFLNEKNEWLKK